MLDPRVDGLIQNKALTITLNDVRLYDALRVLADMAELKMVYVGNMYYITTPENAKVFQPTPPPRPVLNLNQLSPFFNQPVPQPNPMPKQP